MTGFFKAWRRRRLLRRYRIEDALWDSSVGGFDFIRNLDQGEKTKLKQLALLLLAEKEFVGAAGLALTDAIRV